MDAGCLSSCQMLKKLKENIDALDRDEGLDVSTRVYRDFRKTFRDIYDFVLASLQYQTTLKGSVADSSTINIEDFVMVLRQLIDKEFIIPYPLVGNWNDKILKWELTIRKDTDQNIFQLFKNFIVRELIDWTTYDPTKAKELLNPIEEIITCAENFKLNIFSLNYDLVFEQIINQETKRQIEIGFSATAIGEDRKDLWNENVLDDPHSETKINLYKLHGSLDWDYDEELEQISLKEDILDGKEPLIIFGSSYKMLSFDPFLYMLGEFRNKLRDANMLIVIGYSFHDKYVNNLLIQQLNAQPLKRLIIVDPGLHKTREEFADWLKSLQASKSINDVINFKQTNPEKIEILPITAKKFYTDYLGGQAAALIAKLNEITQEDQVF